MLPRPPERPVKAPASSPVLTGLASSEAARTAFEVLTSVSWRGYVPDANVASARDFLAAL